MATAADKQRGFRQRATRGRTSCSARQAADYRHESEMIRREEDLLQHRYYYVDAIKRVLKNKRLAEPDLRAAAEKLTNRKDRWYDLLRRVRGPNPALGLETLSSRKR